MNHKPERYLPLYEAKMMHQFTHRWATYEANGKTRDMTPDELRDPTALPLPRYWVDEREVEARLDRWDRGWLLGFRNIARSTDERTAISGIVPKSAVGHAMPLLLLHRINMYAASLIGNISTIPFDYIVRQKLGGIISPSDTCDNSLSSRHTHTPSPCSTSSAPASSN